jgi:hypothetical protein
MKTWLKTITYSALSLALIWGLAVFAAPSATLATVSVSGTTARTGNLGSGMPHVVHCTVAVTFKYGDSTVTATTAATPLDAAATWTDKTTVGKTYIAFITTGATGTCYVEYDP